MAPDEAAVNPIPVEKLFAGEDDYTLLRIRSQHLQSVATIQRIIQIVEAELYTRLIARGATAIDDPDFECFLKAAQGTGPTRLVIKPKEKKETS